MQFLIAANADVDTQDNGGVTPLMQAAANGFLFGVQLLLSANANVNLKTLYGETALLWATSRNQYDCARLLTQK